VLIPAILTQPRGDATIGIVRNDRDRRTPLFGSGYAGLGEGDINGHSRKSPLPPGRCWHAPAAGSCRQAPGTEVQAAHNRARQLPRPHEPVPREGAGASRAPLWRPSFAFSAGEDVTAPGGPPSAGAAEHVDLERPPLSSARACAPSSRTHTSSRPSTPDSRRSSRRPTGRRLPFPIDRLGAVPIADDPRSPPGCRRITGPRWSARSCLLTTVPWLCDYDAQRNVSLRNTPARNQ
jgi:hypothetical protein